MVLLTKTFLPLLSAAVLALALVLPVCQAQAQHAAGHGETIERQRGADHFAAGGMLSIDWPVPGDLIAAGGDIDVSADVGGDAVASGGHVRLAAAIGQGVYAAGGRITLDGPVQRNVRMAGGRVDIGKRAKISGNASLGGGEVRVAGSIDGYLQVGGGRVFIDGPVGGNVEVAAGNLELGPNARIGGSLRYASGDPLKRDAASQVQGTIERFELPSDWPVPADMHRNAGRGAGWIWSLGLIAMAALLVAALPGVFGGVGETLRSRWPMAMLVGFIALVCIPVVALLAMLTLIGAPAGLAALALYFALLVAGYVTAGIGLGDRTLMRLWPERWSRAGWRVLAAVLGMLAITLLARLPVVGWLFVLLAMLLGIGALLLRTAAGMRRATRPP